MDTNEIEHFHIILQTMYNMSTTEEERAEQKDDDVLYFDFETGRYSISYKDLKEKAAKEIETAIENEHNRKTVQEVDNVS